MNPTIFEIHPNDPVAIAWLVDNRNVPQYLTNVPQKPNEPQEWIEFIDRELSIHGRLIASWYRPGEFWDREVFVCPKCVHATVLDEGEELDYPVNCKYCYTEWEWDERRGLVRCVYEYDDDGNIVATTFS